MKNISYILIVIFLIVSPIFLPLEAAGESDGKRMDKIEALIEEMKRENSENNKRVADALALLEELKMEILVIRGGFEENKHSLDEYQGKTKKFLEDSDSRLTSIEDRLSTIYTQINQLLSEMSSTGKPENSLYYEVLAAINRQQYNETIKIADSFLEKHSKHENAPKVQYWKGEAYFAMKDYKSAIPEYQKVVKNYPSSAQVPSALLKQGISFYELGATDDAKIFFQKLMTEHPTSDDAAKGKAWLERIEKAKAPPAQPKEQAVKKEPEVKKEAAPTGPGT